jgi:proton-translocating NADH-quinone oxidoreductase chain L
MLLSIIITPLIVFLVLSFFGRYFGQNGAAIIAPFFMVGNALCSFVAFYHVGLLGNFSYICLGTWIDCGSFIVNWGFVFDSLTVTMLVVINTVSAAVHVYSTSYMKKDPHFTRFISYLSLFTFFMLVLVSADNFIQLFLGWEGVGLSSYLLINFWFTRVHANQAAFKAIILNRIGDFSLVYSILLIFFFFGTVDFGTVFLLVPLMSEFYFTVHFDLFIFIVRGDLHVLSVISLFLFIGAMAKSAQIGLHTWLPDAMEGPTPVSALLHAATMVTAGIFLIIRCSPLFEYTPSVLTMLVFVGSITSFFGATISLAQNDIKKIIAYSTCSQLGYMCFACGFSGYSPALFHLVNHAFFKALLFLSAGAVIHGLANEQDIRRMGGLVSRMPLTYTMFLLGSLSLIGFPFLSGFYSKDLLLDISFGKYSLDDSFSFWLGTVSATLTSFYSFRLLYFIFFGQTNVINFNVWKNIHEVPITMAVSLTILCFGSIFSGYIFEIFFETPEFFKHTIFTKEVNSFENKDFLPLWIKMTPTLYSLFGLVLASYFANFTTDKLDRFLTILFCSNSSRFSAKTRDFLAKGWYFDSIYSNYIATPFFRTAFVFCFKFLDQYFLKFFGPIGTSIGFYRESKFWVYKDSGLISNYAYCLCYVLLILLFIVWLTSSY